MSERKVLTKYYPPDFDPSTIGRTRAPKKTGPKVQTVRLMAPFSMRCTACGEYVYRGRKFNARKETPEDMRYLNIQIFRFYIRCTRCSAEITFRTDPRNGDYAIERGAKRNTEPWRRGLEATEEETDEARLDRLEREQAEAEGVAQEERNAMVELEAKTAEARREMAVADALDEIRSRNARVERAAAAAREDGGAEEDGPALRADGLTSKEEELLRQEREDAEAAKRAFAFARLQAALEEKIDDEDMDVDGDSGSSSAAASLPPANGGSVLSTEDGDVEVKKPAATAAKPAVVAKPVAEMPPPPPPPPASFKRQVKKKKDHAALLGIKKKPSLV